MLDLLVDRILEACNYDKDTVALVIEKLKAVEFVDDQSDDN